jgi:hypothetical protein
MKRRYIYLLAATMAATITLAFLAGCSSGKRDGAAERLVFVKAVSPHLPFGDPSEADSDPDNRLVLRQQFAASWNASKRIPNWVAWRLVASDIGDTERSSFTPTMRSRLHLRRIKPAPDTIAATCALRKTAATLPKIIKRCSRC